MAITVKKENSWWDRLLKKNFIPYDYYKYSHSDIVNYNPVYLSIYFNLKSRAQPCMHSINLYGSKSFHEHLLKTRFETMLPVFDAHEKRPWFIMDGQTDLLARLRLSGKELRALKGKEVAFYFFEPLFQVNPSHSKWPAPYGRNTEVVFPELIYLEQFLENHGHAFTAAAYVCDYRLNEEYLKPREVHQSIKVNTWDIFVQQTVTGYFEADLYEGKGGLRAASTFGKKFICPNFRYEAVRELVVSYLLGSPYGNEGHCSFFFHSKDSDLFNGVPFDFTQFPSWSQIKAGRENLQTKVPMILDTKANKALDPRLGLPDFEKGHNVPAKNRLEYFYHDAFLAVVNESRYSTLCGEISEKVLLPIRYGRPFILVGGPYTLRYLREQGFETFSEFWDESYDEIEDHGQRLQAIFKVLDSILSKPLPELQELYERMAAKLERNRRFLIYNYRDKMYEDLRSFQRRS